MVLHIILCSFQCSRWHSFPQNLTWDYRLPWGTLHTGETSGCLWLGVVSTPQSLGVSRTCCSIGTSTSKVIKWLANCIMGTRRCGVVCFAIVTGRLRSSFVCGLIIAVWLYSIGVLHLSHFFFSKRSVTHSMWTRFYRCSLQCHCRHRHCGFFAAGFVCFSRLSVSACVAWLIIVISFSSVTPDCRNRGRTSLTMVELLRPVSTAFRKMFCTSACTNSGL